MKFGLSVLISLSLFQFAWAEEILRAPRVFGARPLKMIPPNKSYDTLIEGISSSPDPQEFNHENSQVWLFGKDSMSQRWVVMIQNQNSRTARYLVNEQELEEIADFEEEKKLQKASAIDLDQLRDEDRPHLVKKTSSNATKAKGTQKCKVALTFDDGPHASNTPSLINFFKTQDVKASFFVTAQNAASYSTIMQQMASARSKSAEPLFLIANHSKTHAKLTSQNADLNVEIAALESNNVYKKYLSDTQFKKYFRAPYGAFNPSILAALAQSGYSVPHVHWDVDSEDWKIRNSMLIARKTIAEIREKCKNANLRKQGVIVLMHDIHKFSVDAVMGTDRYPNGIVSVLKDEVEFIRLNEVSRDNPMLMGTELIQAKPRNPKAIHGNNASGVKANGKK